jgi:hypothetical protein
VSPFAIVMILVMTPIAKLVEVLEYLDRFRSRR